MPSVVCFTRTCPMPRINGSISKRRRRCHSFPIVILLPPELFRCASQRSTVRPVPCRHAARQDALALRRAGSSPARPAAPRFPRQRKGLQSAWRAGSCRAGAGGGSCSCSIIWRDPSAAAKALRHAERQTESLPPRRVVCSYAAWRGINGNLPIASNIFAISTCSYFLPMPGVL
jgi:hypothetical protein